MMCQSYDYGIYTMASLACFMHIKPGLNQQELSRLTGQSDSSVGQWINLYDLHGLVALEITPKKHGGAIRQTVTGISYTDKGQKLHDAVNAIFKHA